jgi:predicted small secreted protein
MRIAYTILMASFLVTGILSLSACSNTFKGAGRDIENAGENIQDAAD